ncbi:MAG TPA: class I SAM-dependent methyltransferase [Phycisphaerae bacterium]|nr:class I SAM-dependent methyltransferase [Phycisphaerae bacterium]
MRREELEQFRHPKTKERLALQVESERDGEVETGMLSAGGSEFKIVRGIPRFCPAENYAESFGFQWNLFATTQLDSQAPWGPQSEKRLDEETHWPKDLSGQRILEAGSGMGRFTEILGRRGAQLCTFDYSTAVDANRKNNGHFKNVSFAQGDIYDPPYEFGSFDKVLCIGVIQHCPNPKAAFLSLVRFLKPGGEIMIDHYRLWWKSLFFGKYYMRPFTRKMSPESLHKFVRFHVGWVYPLTGTIYKILGRPVRGFAWGLGMADYRGVYKISDAALREHSLLDTFDMLAPAYDRPKTAGMIRRWFKEAGLVDVEVKPGWNGLEARGRKPA